MSREEQVQQLLIPLTHEQCTRVLFRVIGYVRYAEGSRLNISAKEVLDFAMGEAKEAKGGAL